MLRKSAVAGTLVVAFAVLGTTPTQAQVSVGTDVAFNSHYVWRGLTYTNKFVIQPDVWLSAYGFTAGGWANIEPAKYDDPNDLSESGGLRTGIAEIDPWVEYNRDFGAASGKFGWTAYLFNEDNGTFSDVFNTNELYGQISLNNLPVTPTLYAALDVDKVEGAYIQPSLTYAPQLTETVSLRFGALAGFSAGQAINESDSTETFNFAENGLTHVDFSGAASITAGPVYITPALHFQINSDDFTKITGAEDDNLDKDTKFWGGVTLSWSTELGAGGETEPTEPTEPTDATE